VVAQSLKFKRVVFQSEILFWVVSQSFAVIIMTAAPQFAPFTEHRESNLIICTSYGFAVIHRSRKTYKHYRNNQVLIHTSNEYGVDLISIHDVESSPRGDLGSLPGLTDLDLERNTRPAHR
jgi:hypothetical protein